ncbi:MAG: carboxypeptidase regulatory-like domain-containing protein [Anaerolineales bacterium]|nr:carboxypeptidase regulatory-like domain-containing protein [Anaerolineales bacterium]
MNKTGKSSYVILFAVLAILALAAAGCGKTEPADPGTITGRVYLDEDANAECDLCDCDFYLEGIVIQLYEGNCGGVVHQIVETDAEGIFTFSDMPPGDYCISPKVKTICEGYKPTTPIQQKITLLSGETAEVPWFGFDNNLDIRD